MLIGKSPRASTFVVECPFSASPEPAYAGMKVHEEFSLTASDLRKLQKSVLAFTVPWFDVFEQQNYDFECDCRWLYGYVLQTDGPFIANFTFTRDRAGFAVALDDNSRTTTRWTSFATVPAAVSAVWGHIEEKISFWSSGMY